MVDIHPDRVKRVKVPETKESLYLVTIDPMVKSGLQQRFYGSNTASAQNAPLPYPEFWKRVDEMAFGEASHLAEKPLVGPFAVQMEIYMAPEDSLISATAHPTKGESYQCYRYSGSKKKGYVTIHPDRVKKVSETLVDYFLILAEKPNGVTVMSQRIPMPFEEVQIEIPKVDKKSAHNLIYGESLDGLQKHQRPNIMIWYSYLNNR